MIPSSNAGEKPRKPAPTNIKSLLRIEIPDGSFQRKVNDLIVKSLKIAGVVVCIGVLTCVSRAQTYQVGPNGSTPNADEKKPSQSQQLGWGSNIQNARLARAAELALQHGDRAQALEFAQ